MRMRTSVVLALLAGGIAPAVTVAQVKNPRPIPRHRTLQLAPASRAVAPDAYAGIRRMPDGTYRLTTEWIPYQTTVGGPDAPTVPIFDCYEANPDGSPTGFCEGECVRNDGCTATPPTPAGSRWWFGPTYINPFLTNDMASIATGYNGAQAKRVTVDWNWGNVTGGNCYIAVFTSETFNDCTLGPPATAGDYDGVIFTFNALPAGGWYSDIDLSAGALFFQMPLDGSGAYQIVLASAFDPITGALTIDVSPGTQSMLWSTGNNEVPPDGRAGTETSIEWDDDAIPDGQYTLLECYDNGGFLICPTVLSGMVLFWGEPTGPTPCYANCDNSTLVPVLNVGDFTCFLQRYAAGDSYANCDNSTTPPVLNVGDFTCFLIAYAAGCP